MAIRKSDFGGYNLYTIENASGASVSITDLGATVQSVIVPDKDGVMGDVVLGYDTPQEYLERDSFLGAFVGRYANRISGASFGLGGKTYSLTSNEGGNTLHGGGSLNRRSFVAQPDGDRAVVMSIFDPDGSDGFPGNLSIAVRYEFTDDCELRINYLAETDADTHISLSNHCYFNLSCGGDILRHTLMINADSYLPVGDGLIPTGELIPVENTQFDFRRARAIVDGFYDHCFVLSGEPCAKLYDLVSGRKLTVKTDLPAVQFYAGGSLTPQRGKHGAYYDRCSGLCLETQHFPDAPNRPAFPSALVKAGEAFRSETVYEFSVI